MLACAAAGADVVDVAIDCASSSLSLHEQLLLTSALSSAMSGMTSQPSMGAVCSALEQTNLGTGISQENIAALNLYWSNVRQLYQCFDANVRSSDSGVFQHAMPGSLASPRSPTQN
jgi:pyruvate carboxylase